MPSKSLSLITFHNGSYALDKIDGNMEIIEKYIRLGIVKEFKPKDYHSNYFKDF